ncbi:MAG: 50S ribosomal protein L7/L12 [Candidatus Doudnabacteria bacterium RIFCSPHIGHO2_01_FULL_43_23]|uniref:Large ribosomal subunit protein bL12 n=1 Tax=Candidatus Doudnabacteria bacterium RIFCSPHIGHO2_01_FULL_43_23 TaxID=1817822 RepID=A0A1F5NU24_9BACT|nr:MAG: 50S ribosomal protein L7/L12 [Candidatus Doudnabacteria bacterium RIFCSPHIGHO2_01_FULL_43_23]
MSEEQTAKVEIPEKFKPLVDQIDKLTALELSELVKSLEGHYGVSAAASMAVAVAGGAGESAAEEQSSFNVELTASGDKKINVIKVVKEVTGKGLKDAKDLVDGAPKVIKENVSKQEAEELKKKLEEAGATVTLK